MAAVAALDNPIRQVYLPGVVGRARRSRVVGLNALSYNAGAVAGPAIAGALLPVVGPGPCLLLNAASYLAVLAVLTAGPAGRPVGMTRGGLWGGVAYLRTAAHPRSLLSLVALVSLLGRSYPQVLPALVGDRWHGTARAYGTPAVLPGVGAAVAAVLVALVLGRRDHPGFRSLGAVLLGIAVAALGLAPGLVPAGAILVLVGLLATGTMTLLNAGLQVAVPGDVQGRVLSLYTLLAAGMPALGGWLLGTALSPAGPPVVIILAGAVLSVLALRLGRASSRSTRHLSP